MFEKQSAMNQCDKIRSACIWSLIPLVLCALAWADGVERESRPAVRPPKVIVAPKLSDYLDAQRQPPGLRITDFLQREPNDGAPANLKTTAFLSYDSTNLYVAFLCKEDHRLLRAHVSRREEITEDDRVSVALDTFHDGRRAYAFFVNPLGIQRDGIITEGQDDDFSFDALWTSEGRLTPDGFAVLIAIPFKSLRFDPAHDRTWGIALGRYSPATKEFSTWPLLTAKIETYVAQFSTLEAVGESSPGHSAQFIPYISFARQRFLNEPEGAAPAMKQENEFRGGLDAKFVLHDAFTVDFMANPDFSQVESDEPQVTVNQRYEVFFPEKRPFFTEGAGFFETPEELFFSRRIVDPQFGLRMTGKAGGWAMGMLASDDRAPGRLVPAGDPMAGERANIGVFRVQRELGKQSTVGVLYSRRHFGQSSNDVLSFDARLKFGKNWVFTGQTVRSRADDPVDGQTTGSDHFAEIRRTGLHLNYFSSYLDRSPQFRADLGFIPRVDVRESRNNFSYLWRPTEGALTSFGPTLDTHVIWDQQGRLQEWLVDAPFSFTFKGPTSISVGRLEELETFQNIRFREHASYIYFSTQRLRWLGVDASYIHGTNVNYSPAAGLLPFLGRSDDLSMGITVRPTARLRLDETYLFSGLGTAAGVHGAAVFDEHLFRTKLSYQFTRALSLRAIVDYNATLSNPQLIDLDRAKRLTGDLLLTYLVHPGTAIYLGYTDRRENLSFAPENSSGLRRTGFPGFSTGQQFFVKVSYLLRF